MPVTTTTLQDGSKVSLVYLGRTSQPRCVFTYLQNVKTGRTQPLPEQLYFKNLSEYATRFAEEVAKLAPFDALLVPPTRRFDLVKPYADAVCKRLPGVADLTAVLGRDDAASFGRARSYAEVQDAIHLKDPNADLFAVRRLLVIDDVYARGFTVSAIRDLFAKAGGVADGVVVACPLIADHW